MAALIGSPRRRYLRLSPHDNSQVRDWIRFAWRNCWGYRLRLLRMWVREADASPTPPRKARPG